MRKLRKLMRRNRLFCKPFKGQYAYEWPLFAIVLQWRHDGNPWTHGRGIVLGRLYVWYDRAWLF